MAAQLHSCLPSRWKRGSPSLLAPANAGQLQEGAQESKQTPGWINCLPLNVMLLPGSLLSGDSSAAQLCTVWGQDKGMR